MCLGVLSTEKVAELHLLCEKLEETLSCEGVNYQNQQRGGVDGEVAEIDQEDDEEGEREERRRRRKGKERDSYSSAKAGWNGGSLSPSDRTILAVASAYAVSRDLSFLL